MIKRFHDGRPKPYLSAAEYAQLRDDDRFLYNEEPDPSARITGDKGRENPAEGAPYGEGLIGRITELEHDNALLRRALSYAQGQQLSLMGERAKLLEALERCLEELYAPEAGCSCHISPPCADCVDYASIREAQAIARAALEGSVDRG